MKSKKQEPVTPLPDNYMPPLDEIIGNFLHVRRHCIRSKEPEMVQLRAHIDDIVKLLTQ